MTTQNPFPRFKALALDEVCRLQDFMHLLMKPRNGARWTAQDKSALLEHLRRAARTLPILGIFALPGGVFLLPLLALILDRRKERNRPAVAQEMIESQGTKNLASDPE